MLGLRRDLVVADVTDAELVRLQVPREAVIATRTTDADYAITRRWAQQVWDDGPGFPACQGELRPNADTSSVLRQGGAQGVAPVTTSVTGRRCYGAQLRPRGR